MIFDEDQEIEKREEEVRDECWIEWKKAFSRPYATGYSEIPEGGIKAIRQYRIRMRFLKSAMAGIPDSPFDELEFDEYLECIKRVIDQAYEVEDLLSQLKGFFEDYRHDKLQEMEHAVENGSYWERD